ncbi:hypothetical protein QJS10_CPA03g00084 [Acorus calamus]|uniref:MLO-like protein n=1 Tax=Acorus calamus TaxID=4465 RepID=A0AAV9F4Y4_ACOCL|nr:hypothetical protein QJS10_CPA03g00084 [Acorus calamus]
MADRSLENTPTWAITGVCFVLIAIALGAEYGLHLLASLFTKKKTKPLDQALERIKAELRSFGFMSLLLTVGEQPISKICISKSLGGSFLPCESGEHEIEVVGESSCEAHGKVPLMSIEAGGQLQMLIFVLAAFHVLSCLLTLGLGMAKMRRWKFWEEETQSLEYQLCNDSRRFMLSRETPFGKRHLKSWSDHQCFLWIVCSYRQFFDSVSKADYLVLRQGFITTHVSKHCKFNFNKFLSRALDKDFVAVVGISIWNWVFAILSILFNAHSTCGCWSKDGIHHNYNGCGEPK